MDFRLKPWVDTFVTLYMSLYNEQNVDFEGNENRFTDFSINESVDDPNECWNPNFTVAEFCHQSIA